MDLAGLEKISTTEWRIEPTGAMRVPAILYADEALIGDMDEKVREQAVNVATLPGIVRASYAMPDAHWGYGFPIGGVAAFDADQGGVVSAGGVGFDISCGVRTHLMRWTAPHKASRCRRVIVEDESPERAAHDKNYHHWCRPCKEGVSSPRRRCRRARSLSPGSSDARRC